MINLRSGVGFKSFTEEPRHCKVFLLKRQLRGFQGFQALPEFQAFRGFQGFQASGIGRVFKALHVFISCI